jgi:hypothetical protein
MGWWIDRVASRLRPDTPLSDSELQTLLKESPDGVLDYFIQNENFQDTVMDFNVFYLGFKNDNMGLPDGSFILHDRSWATIGPAVAAARAVVEGGDYFEIYNLDNGIYAGPLLSEDINNVGEMTQPPLAERREKLYQNWEAHVQKFHDAVAAKPDMDIGSFCGILFEDVDDIFANVADLGTPFFMIIPFFNEARYFGDASKLCTDFENQNKNEKPLAIAKRSLAQVKDMFKYLREMQDYQPTTLAELKTYDWKRLGLQDSASGLQHGWLFSALENSSTNSNRKRASYILKRFFCDDLTPIAIQTPEGHTGNAHADDPGCQSCHYKLDPIGGFFRYNGAQGRDMRDEKEIRFDDGAQADLKEYVSQWRAEDKSWNVGYIRSPESKELNDYGDNLKDPDLKDLFTIIKRSPETKKCLVKSMFKYLVGEKTSLDAGYLDHLTQKFNQATEKSGSSIAFKESFKTILTSQSFTEIDPVQGTCYDYAPGIDAEGRPPCKVASIIENACSSCHSDQSAAGGLDLMTWKPNRSGELGFVHIREGAEVPASETFSLIYERLSSPDPKLRMPLNKYMDAVDREAIYLWASSKISEGEADAE